MKTTAAQRAILESLAADIERLGRPESVRETFEQGLERAGELAEAGLWFESRNVANEAIKQARGA